VVDGRSGERRIIDKAARTDRGRKYLDRVRQALKDASEKGTKARAGYIAETLT
jgi:hypothetical protein